MKIIAVADTHLGITCGRTPEAREKFRQQVFNQFNNIAQYTIEKDIPVFLHAGDVFDRSKPPKWAIRQYTTVIEDLLSNDINVVINPGNHDRGELTKSLLEYFYSNYHIFNTTRSIRINTIQIIGFPFEYYSPPTVFNQIIKDNEFDAPSIILCHQLFAKSTFGPQKYMFDRQENVIHPVGIPPQVQVVTGHIHRAQSLNKGQIVYPGSTVRTSYSEVIEPKGYIEIEIETNSIAITFIPIETMKMKILEISHQELINNHLPNLSPSDDRILIRITGEEISTRMINQLYIRYPKEQFPYLRISPIRPNVILKPLYSKYTDEFVFDQIYRQW